MALHFSCNQYQQAFDPRRLQNWNVPHRYRKHPVAYEGFTKVIASDRGHLLPGIPRSTRSPWGAFVGTWDLPKQIPGNKLTDPTARRKEEYYKNMERRSGGQAVILGRLKVRRAQAGAYEDLMQEPVVSREDEARSQRSGAANPLAKTTQAVLQTGGSARPAQDSSRAATVHTPTGASKAAAPESMAAENDRRLTPQPQSPVGRQVSRHSKEPAASPAREVLSSHSPKPFTPLASGERMLYSPQMEALKAFSPIL